MCTPGSSTAPDPLFSLAAGQLDEVEMLIESAEQFLEAKIKDLSAEDKEMLSEIRGVGGGQTDINLGAEWETTAILDPRLLETMEEEKAKKQKKEKVLMKAKQEQGVEEKAKQEQGVEEKAKQEQGVEEVALILISLIVHIRISPYAYSLH